MGNFSVVYEQNADKKDYTKRLWTVPEWRYFLEDIVVNVLKEKFEIHIKMGPNMSPEAVNAVAALSYYSEPQNYMFSLNESMNFNHWPGS